MQESHMLASRAVVDGEGEVVAANLAGAGCRLSAYRALTHHGLGMACEFRRFRTTRHRYQRSARTTKDQDTPTKSRTLVRQDPPQRSHQHRASARRGRVPNATDDILERLAKLQSRSRQKLVVRSKDCNVV